MFEDLKEAIEEVLRTSKGVGELDYELDYALIMRLDYALRVLQAEYNIHFVEPEEVQLEIV